MAGLSDGAIIIATLLGPILAVQIQKWLEISRERKNRQVRVFQTLMATRSSSLSPPHVEALNAIPIEFHGSGKALTDINNSFKEYLDHHVDRVGMAFDQVWWSKREELSVDLLMKMSNFLGYKFSKVQLKSDLYNPKISGQIEEEQTVIRQGMAKLFKGEFDLPMDVKGFPVDETALDEQAEIRKLLLVWLKNQSAIKVKIEN